MKNNLIERVTRIEGILDQMVKGLNHIKSEVRDLKSELRSEIRDLKRDLNYRFYWLLGVQLSMWVTIIPTTLFK